MAFQGEYFVDRYGAAAAERTPPVRRMLEMGVPVGAGTDATRVANDNPWNSLYWLVTGKTAGSLCGLLKSFRITPRRTFQSHQTGRRWLASAPRVSPKTAAPTVFALRTAGPAR